MVSDDGASIGGSRPQWRSSGTQLIELPREECIELLSSHRVGRLAFVSSGIPVILPINYIFDSAAQAVVFRTGRGSKLDAALHGGRVSFEIDGIDESARTGWSVVISGATAEMAAAYDISRLDRSRLRPWAPGPKPHWVRLPARTLSGRRIVLPSRPVAGAYHG